MAHLIPLASRDRDALIEAVSLIQQSELPVWVLWSLTDMIGEWDRMEAMREPHYIVDPA